MRWWEVGPHNCGDKPTVPDVTVEPDDEQPSIMRQLLSPEDVERLEIAPGQWYFPGVPP